MTRPKLKNFFAPEPKCKVLGSGKKCVTGKLPSYITKQAVSNAWLDAKIMNKAYEMLAKTKQSKLLTESADALTSLPLNMWSKARVGEKIDKMFSVGKESLKLNQKMGRTLKHVGERYPTFFNEERARKLKTLAEESYEMSGKTNKLMKGVGKKMRSKTKLLKNISNN